jgi:hypothetical protein
MTKKIPLNEALAQMERATDKRVLRVGAVEYHPTVEQPREGDEEVMCVLVSDVQFGHKTPTTTARIVHNRAGRLAQSVVRIASLHRHMYPIRKLYVFMLGDMVHNLPPFFMNFAEMEMALYEQVYDNAVPMLAGLLKTWAKEFEEVHVVCIPGNHAKQGGKMGDNRFNLDTIIYLTLRQMFVDNPRVVWEGDGVNWWQKTTIFQTTFLSVQDVDEHSTLRDDGKGDAMARITAWAQVPGAVAWPLPRRLDGELERHGDHHQRVLRL